MLSSEMIVLGWWCSLRVTLKQAISSFLCLVHALHLACLPARGRPPSSHTHRLGLVESVMPHQPSSVSYSTGYHTRPVSSPALTTIPYSVAHPTQISYPDHPAPPCSQLRHHSVNITDYYGGCLPLLDDCTLLKSYPAHTLRPAPPPCSPALRQVPAPTRVLYPSKTITRTHLAPSSATMRSTLLSGMAGA
jgi:hypothetical protein